jgi:RHS repeat-associated protein
VQNGTGYLFRTTSVSAPGYSAGYTYAADGIRLRVQESNNPNPDRWMQYDGVRPALESLLDSQGNLQTILAKYVWEGNSYYDPLVFGYIGGAWRHPLYDGLGSTRQLIKQSDQTVTDTYQYEAFGNLLSSTGSTPNPYRYVGSLGYYQTGSSLMHLGARYYLPEVGRFTAPDGLARGTVNRSPRSPYAYAQSCPSVRVDPMGLYDSEYCILAYTNCMKDAGLEQTRCQIGCAWGVGFCGGLPGAIACGVAGVTKNPIALAICLGLGVGDAIIFAWCWHSCGREYDAVSESCETAYQFCIGHAQVSCSARSEN